MRLRLRNFRRQGRKSGRCSNSLLEIGLAKVYSFQILAAALDAMVGILTCGTWRGFNGDADERRRSAQVTAPMAGGHRGIGRRVAAAIACG